jgi:hypothetical protein
MTTSAGSFDGDQVFGCETSILALTPIQAIIVSGAPWNPCGHALLGFGGTSLDAQYYHVSVGFPPVGPPKRLSQTAYTRYLEHYGKHEIRRETVHVPDPGAAYRCLFLLCSRPWLWLVFPNNCVTFVETVIQAGGGHWALATNCPVKEYELIRGVLDVRMRAEVRTWMRGG